MSFVTQSVLAAALATSLQMPLAAQSRPDGLYAEIHTNKGLIVARLEADLAPLAVANFVGLAEGTIANAAFDPGRPFYDGSVYHRVVPGHVIQTGVPRSTKANGPGYTFPNEISARLSHNHAGAVQMANAGPNTNAAQFCVTLGDRSYLDGDYIVFGEVVTGMDVVFRVVQGDTVDSVRIARVGPKATAYHVTDSAFRAMVQIAQVRVADHAVKKQLAEEAWIKQNYPNATGPAGGVLTQQLARGSGAVPTGPRRLRFAGKRVRYLGAELDYAGPPLEVASFASDSNAVPEFGEQAQAFTLPAGARINPGLDSAIAHLTPGERRIVIVPAAWGYGVRGFYTAEAPGKRRFVISPNTLLVYDIELLAH
ncbi:MAG TPA: peptidylprolyl isomerase [Gemmatimonadales bacterium]|jgi:peptidylprolyl isomerase